MFLKRLTVLTIAFIMTFGMFTLCEGANERRLVYNLSTVNNIAKSTFPATSEFKRSGDYTLKWADGDIYRDIKMDFTDDFTDGKFLEFWVYSQAPTNSKFTLALLSDNNQTPCSDYYFATINVSFSGWRLFSLDLENDFTPVKTPMGFNNIQGIKILSSFQGEKPVSGTTLYFDSFYLSHEKSSQATDSTNKDESKDYMIANFSKSSDIISSGFTPSREQIRSGDVTLKWANDDLKRAPIFTNFPEDWTQYGFLEMWIYSEVATNSKLVMGVSSENPLTEGNDYYYYNLMVDWTGWKQLLLPVGRVGTFQQSRTPLGWNKITGFDFWPGFGGEFLDPKTVLYIDTVSLKAEGSSISNDTDYIIPAVNLPNDKDVVSMIKKKYPQDSHPRMIMTEADFTNLKKLSVENDFIKEVSTQVIKTATALLDAPIQTYDKPDGLRLPTTAAAGLPTLAMAYKLTGDEKYAKRAWLDVEAVCKFPDWNPSHFLDVADTARGVALCYDWLYDYFNDQQKRFIRNAMVSHGLGASMEYYRTGTGFTHNENNWNQVINSGIGMIAVAIGDDAGYENLANEVINRTFESLPYATKFFAPDGASPEGPAYWGYTQWGYFQYIASLVSATDSDFGFATIDGNDKTGYFPLQLTGPSGKYFNFADASPETFGSGVLFFLSAYNNQPELANYMIQTNGGDYTTLMYYRENPSQYIDYKTVLPKDAMFRGQQNVASLRSSWTDKNASFVSFKGGDNQASHGDLDIGSFVFECSNYRWFVELGREVYEYPGMWDFGVGGGRWNYYRKRAEGQNTLVINPKSTEDQYPYAKAPIYKMENSDYASYGLVDMSEAYSADTTSVKRGIGLVNNRSTLLVQDEIKTKKSADVYSFFHTYANITVSENKKTAILDNGVDKLRADILSGDENYVFEVMDATPFPTSPKAQNSPNIGVKKLAVHVKNAINPTISVSFTPLKKGQDENVTTPKFLPLSKWSEYLKDNLQLKSIMLDGISLNEFDTYKTSYLVDDGIIGNISAIGNDNTQIAITQAKKDGDTAIIKVKSLQSGSEQTYGITFSQKKIENIASYLKTYEIKDVVASATPQDANIPKNTFDNDLNTRWSADGEQWIFYDLGEKFPISSVGIAFMNGDKRNTIFDILVSENNVDWKTVYSGRSSGKTNEKEIFEFPQENARYIKILGKGNTENTWNSITEISMIIPIVGFLDIQNHWAKNEIQDLATMGIVSGVGENLYNPEKTVSRSEFISMLVRSLELEQKEFTCGFSDVDGETWYAPLIQSAYDYGIIPPEMTTGNLMKPLAEITREEMCAIIILAYEKATSDIISPVNLDRFDDKSEISPWATPYIEKGISIRIISGIDYNRFAPKNNLTRAESAVMIKRLLTKIN